MMMIEMIHELIAPYMNAAGSLCLAQARPFVAAWKIAQQEFLLTLEGIHLHFLGEIKSLAQSDVSKKKLPSLLEETLQKQIAWVQSFQAYDPKIPPLEPIQQWRTAFTQLAPPAESTKPSPDLNEDNPKNQMNRFLSLHLEHPISEALLKLRRQLLRETAQIFHQLHDEAEAWIEQFLKREGEHLEEETLPLLTYFQNISPPVGKQSIEFDRIEKEGLEGLIAHCQQTFEEAERLWDELNPDHRAESLYKKPSFEEHSRRLDTDAEKLLDGWKRHFGAEQDDWQKDLELAILVVRTTQAHIESEQSLQAKIEKELVPQFQAANDLITLSLKKFKETEEAEKDSSDLKTMILSESRSMLRMLRRETLPAICSLLDQAPLLKNLENCHSRILYAVEKLSESHRLLAQADWDSPFPNPKVSDINLKALVQGEACKKLETEHAALLQQVRKILEGLWQDVSEFDALVEYNLESGLDLIVRSEGAGDFNDVRSEIMDGLERALLQVEQMRERSRGIAVLILENRQNGIASFQQQIKALGQTEKIFELKLRIAKTKTIEQARTYQEKLLGTGQETLSSARSITVKQWGKFRDFYSRMRGFAGLPRATAEGEEILSRFVIENRKKFSALPYVYQRLFRVEALADQRFFEGQETHLAALKTSFDAWRNGEPGMTIIVGEKGSGRTSLINAASPKLYNQLPFFRINLVMQRPASEETLFRALNEAFKMPEASNLNDLEQQILFKKERKIICLEDIQYLFLRTVDGFETLERFLLFMSRTCGTVYWLNTCTLYSWRYLEKTLGLSKFFQQSHFLDRLSRETIETIILKRHRVSGYGLRFEASETHSTSKKQPKWVNPQDFLKTSFFNRLASLADGNISVALLFWLTAIQKIENHTLIISSDLKVDLSTLFRISSDELFTLAALLHHERLNTEEHVWIFRLEAQQSLMLLDRMEKKGIIVRTPEAHYQINPILYRPIVHTLKMRNILH